MDQFTGRPKLHPLSLPFNECWWHGHLPLFSPTSLSASPFHLHFWTFPQNNHLPSHSSSFFLTTLSLLMILSNLGEVLNLSLSDICLISSIYFPPEKIPTAKVSVQVLLKTYSWTISTCLLTLVGSVHHYLFQTWPNHIILPSHCLKNQIQKPHFHSQGHRDTDPWKDEWFLNTSGSSLTSVPLVTNHLKTSIDLKWIIL